MTDLNDIVFTYSAHPRILVDMSGARAPLISHYQYSARTEEEAREKRAIQFLVENTELLGRIRRCLECQAWFFGVTGHQKFCADKCRVRHASHNEIFKAKRARYMRETYRPMQRTKIKLQNVTLGEADEPLQARECLVGGRLVLRQAVSGFDEARQQEKGQDVRRCVFREPGR
jgi:hypothetical protein